jgi:predicted phage tail protein
MQDKNKITLVIIKNPFEPWNGRRVEKIEAGESLQSLMERYGVPGLDMRATVNGNSTDSQYITVDGDFVVVSPVIAKGGGKGILGIIAAIALSIVSLGVGSIVAGGAFMGSGVVAMGSWGFASFLAATAVMFLGSTLISRFTGKQDMGHYDAKTDPTYSWDGTQTMEGQNNAIALTYGTVQSGGQSIGKYVEVRDNKEYLNWLVAAGEGPLTITDVQVNDNPVSFYEGMTLETREGTNDQSPISNFNDTYFTKTLNYQLLDTERIDTAQGNATEGLVVKIEFTNGLYFAQDNGELGTASVDIEGYYRLGENGTWVQFIGGNAQDGHITGNQSSSLRKEYRVDNLTPGEYQVKMQVVGRSHAVDSSRASTRCFWTGLTSIVYDDFCYPNIALVGIKALATDQISGSPTLKFKKTCPYVLVWNPDTNQYEQKASTNPAWASYDVLHQCRKLKNIHSNQFVYDVRGVAARRILYDQFKAWADFCDAKRLYVNIEIVNAGEMLDVINENIANVGRGQVLRFGTRYGCTWDCVRQPVQMFGMGNIVEGTFKEEFLQTSDRANCVELTYMDAANDFSRETITIYSDTYDTDTQERTAQAEFNGITSYEQAYREGMYQLYCNQRLLRTVSFEAGVDAIACTVGDVVLIAHDVPKWARSGRIHEVEGQELLLPVELDDMEGPYRIMYRTVNDNMYTSPVTVLKNKDGWCRLRVANAFSAEDPPQPQDIFDIAYTHKGSKPFVVKSITRAQDFTRKIECLEYDASVYEENYDIPVIQYSSHEQQVKNVTSLSAAAFRYLLQDGSSRYQTDISWVRESNGSYAVYVMDGGKYVLAAEGIRGNSYSYTSVRMPSKVKVVTVGVAARSSGTVANVTLISSIVINKVTGLAATVEHQNDKYNVSAHWNATDAAGFRYYEVSFQGEVYRASGTSMTIQDADTGTYVLAVTVVTYYGRSEEKTVSVTIGGTA